jgi:hypothetical protein
MKYRIQPIVICVAIAVLCAITIMVLDSVSGVPFSYAVPIAVIISLVPYAFMLRRQRTNSMNGHRIIQSAGYRLSESSFAPHETATLRGSHRAATIHSVIFPVAGRDHAQRSTQEA